METFSRQCRGLVLETSRTMTCGPFTNISVRSHASQDRRRLAHCITIANKAALANCRYERGRMERRTGRTTPFRRIKSVGMDFTWAFL
jgi:hypothetical protein